MRARSTLTRRDKVRPYDTISPARGQHRVLQQLPFARGAADGRFEPFYDVGRVAANLCCAD